MTFTRPSTFRVGSMGGMVSTAEVLATVQSARSLLTEPGRTSLELIVLTSPPAQSAHKTARKESSVVLVIVPVRLAPWLRLWAWHLAYPVDEGATSYEWGFTPTLPWTLRQSHRAAEKRLAILRHPSSRHSEE